MLRQDVNRPWSNGRKVDLPYPEVSGTASCGPYTANHPPDGLYERAARTVPRQERGETPARSGTKQGGVVNHKKQANRVR